MPLPSDRFLGINSVSSEIGDTSSAAAPRSSRFGAELSDAEFDKLFVVTSHFYEESFDLSVYAIDVNNSPSSSSIPPEPLYPMVMLTRRRGYTAFVILDYKLYMFGGYTFCGGERFLSWNNYMSIFDLRKAKALNSKTKTTIDFTNRRVERMQGGFVVNGPNMAAAKPWTIAVVIGQFRICVFSRLLYEPPPNYESPQIRRTPSFLSPVFELYDTRKDRWIWLPDPFDFAKLKPKSWVRVDSYCVYGSSLYIRTTLGSRYSYAIDLDNPNPQWVNLYGCNFPLKGMWTTPRPNIRTFGQRRYPNDSTDRESLLELCEHGMVGLGPFNNGCVNLCSVRAGLPYYGNIPNLLVDIVKFDDVSLKKLGFDLSRWKEIQSGKKSFTYSLPSNTCNDVEVVGFFPSKVLDHTPGPMIKQLEDIGLLDSVAISNKVQQHTKGAKGCNRFRSTCLDKVSTIIIGQLEVALDLSY